MVLSEFLERNNISEEQFESADISFDSLCEIQNHYEEMMPRLQEAAGLLANVLQECEHVHSVRWRVKASEHLLEKIVRKRISKSKKYENISVLNYEDVITDLVGVRVLHLFKHEWLDIDQYIKENWKPLEKVIAYIRQGDEGVVVESYKNNKCKVLIHGSGYRSIHYIVSTQPTKKKITSEIQVRTIFEEGWSEIDHKIRYPNFTNDKLVSYFLTIFNRMAGSADEMGSFVNTLVVEMALKNVEFEIKNREQEEYLKKIDDLMDQLSTAKSINKENSTTVTKLKNEINKLRVNSSTLSNDDFGFSRWAEVEKMNSKSKEALKYINVNFLTPPMLDGIKDINLSKILTKDMLDVLERNKKIIDSIPIIKNPLPKKE